MFWKPRRRRGSDFGDAKHRRRWCRGDSLWRSKGGPGMQEMLYPTSYLKSKGLGKACALLTDGRFSGVRRVYPSVTSAQKPLKVVPSVWSMKAIPSRLISLIARFIWRLIFAELENAEKRWWAVATKLETRQSWAPVSATLRAYAAMTTSADTGAVRDVSQVER